MPITSASLAADGSEEGLQRALLNEIALQVRPHCDLVDLIYHIPNGGQRGRDARDAKIQGAKMVALGQKKGIPDLCLPIPMQGFAALYIEMKRPKDGALSFDQQKRIKQLVRARNFVAVIDNWEVGAKLVFDYLLCQNALEFCMMYRIHTVDDSTVIFDPSGYFR